MSKLQQVAMLAALAGAVMDPALPLDRAWSNTPAKRGKLKTGTRKALRAKRKQKRQARNKARK